MNTRQRKIIHLTSGIIRYPKVDCIYELHGTTITFNGREVNAKRCHFYDVYTGTAHFPDTCRSIYGEWIPMSPDYAPLKENPQPVYYFNSPRTLAKISSITITFSETIYNGISLSLDLDFLTTYPHKQSNSELQTACSKSVGIPVSVGTYPIVLGNKKPTFAKLNELYQSFIRYNVDEKLKLQFNNSSLFCHLRSHFICEILKEHGIESAKVTKFYNRKDWLKFGCNTLNDTWKAHVAPLIIDNENNLWVWDPWVGLNHHLVPFQKWVHAKDEPTPTRIQVSSRVTLNFDLGGIPADGATLNHLYPPYFSILQSIAADAIPNPPIFFKPAYDADKRRKIDSSQTASTQSKHLKLGC